MPSSQYQNLSVLDKALLNKYARFSDLASSDSALGDFLSDKPSFFELAGPLLKKFSNPGVSQEDSFFFIYRTGALNTTDAIHPGVSARMIWAAARTVQVKLGAFLAEGQDDHSQYKVRQNPFVLKDGIVSLKVILVRCAFLLRSMPLIYTFCFRASSAYNTFVTKPVPWSSNASWLYANEPPLFFHQSYRSLLGSYLRMTSVVYW